MRSRERRDVVRCASAGIAVACLAAVLSCAPAAAAPSSALIEQKKAEEAAIRAELENKRVELQALLTEYVELGQQMSRAKAEILEVTNDLAASEVALEQAERALEERVVELYRSDRDGLLTLLLTARSLQELWARSTYLAMVNYRDARLVADVRLARQENLWLQQSLLQRLERLHALQREADLWRERIEQDLEAQERRAAQVRVDLARLMWSGAADGTPGSAFSPDLVISEQEFRDASAMSDEEIQAFLDEQPGTLARYRAPDHAGRIRSAAEMIGEAARAWGVNPKVILCVLQKEQSLLERPDPPASAYEWAMGCGKTDSRTITKFKGFGKQIWHGAERLAVNGRGWRPGIEMTIDGSVVEPKNAATYSLFKYTPHFRGTMSFWLLYWRYFGDPLDGER